MYHPTRGGVRGGRDQFSWDDVKVDKHRENYIGHSLKASVGRWQKGKDLHWYVRDKKSEGSNTDALKEEIQRVKEEEEQAMREALGLAPKRANRPQGNRLDKHDFSELVKRGSTAEDLGAGHAEATHVHGIGFSKAPRPWEDPTTIPSDNKEVSVEVVKKDEPDSLVKNSEDRESEDETNRKKRKHEEKKHEKERKHLEKHERREKRRSHNSDDRKKHKKDNNSDDRKKHKKDKKRRHDSDSD